MTPKREGYVFFAWLYETQPYKPGGKFIMPDHGSANSLLGNHKW